MRRISICLILSASLLLNGCGVIQRVLPGSQEEEAETEAEETTEESYELTQLEEGKYYVKSGNSFYEIYIGNTNITSDNLFPESADPTRVISFSDDSLIPTLYSDDSLIYYSSMEIPTFFWERMADYGYTIGAYNMQSNEAGKIEYVRGTSTINSDSTFYEKLAPISGTGGTILIDKINGIKVTGEDLTECGTIPGLTKDAPVTADVYIGTEQNPLDITADTHMIASMELYNTTEYELSPDGYAYIKIPDYFKSGYYFLNGIGVVRYVANPRSQGMSGVDFSDPYYYTDGYGIYTPEEWEERQAQTW